MAGNKRQIQEINAGSMADIAFLLLIFFLVATTMNVDTGLVRMLPPMPPENQKQEDIKVKERNLFLVLISGSGTFSLMGIDKRRAKRGAWRIAERTLFLPVVLFGSLGGTLGMFCFHHKTRHWYFRYGFPILLVVQLLLLGAGAYLLLR